VEGVPRALEDRVPGAGAAQWNPIHCDVHHPGEHDRDQLTRSLYIETLTRWDLYDVQTDKISIPARDDEWPDPMSLFMSDYHLGFSPFSGAQARQHTS
jgi:hypothetical protein